MAFVKTLVEYHAQVAGTKARLLHHLGENKIELHSDAPAGVTDAMLNALHKAVEAGQQGQGIAPAPAPLAPAAPKAKRGRPAKVKPAAKAATPAPAVAPLADQAAPKRRGRPPKAKAAAQQVEGTVAPATPVAPLALVPPPAPLPLVAAPAPAAAAPVKPAKAEKAPKAPKAEKVAAPAAPAAPVNEAPKAKRGRPTKAEAAAKAAAKAAAPEAAPKAEPKQVDLTEAIDHAKAKAEKAAESAPVAPVAAPKAAELVAQPDNGKGDGELLERIRKNLDAPASPAEAPPVAPVAPQVEPADSTVPPEYLAATSIKAFVEAAIARGIPVDKGGASMVKEASKYHLGVPALASINPTQISTRIQRTMTVMMALDESGSPIAAA